MSKADPRKERRTSLTEPVQLSSVHQPAVFESTYTQDISSRGARVMTQRIWEPGSVVRIESIRKSFAAQARVVYWRSFSSSRFAIGLEFLTQEAVWSIPAGHAGSPHNGNSGSAAS